LFIELPAATTPHMRGSQCPLKERVLHCNAKVTEQYMSDKLNRNAAKVAF
jgi:hypothetical protein